MANVIISHTDLYNWLSETVSKTNIEKVTDAFLYSLGSNDLAYRPFLACYVFAAGIPVHHIEKEIYPSGNIACKYCGHCETYPEDSSDLDYELIRYGGIRVDQVFAATYYLDQFLSMKEVKPSKKDYEIFNNIVASILCSDNDAKARDLEKKFSKILKSNKDQREMLIDQLGVIGILDTEKHKGYHSKYTAPDLRSIPAVSKIDWFYPVCWWRGKDKINVATYNYFFGHYSELVKLTGQ